MGWVTIVRVISIWSLDNYTASAPTAQFHFFVDLKFHVSVQPSFNLSGGFIISLCFTDLVTNIL